jgi:hypothetical protein
MSGRPGSGDLDDLYEAAGEHPGEQRTMIVLGVVGMALTLILGAFFVGRGFAEGDDPRAAREESSQGSDADNLAEAALGGDASTAPASPNPPTSNEHDSATGRLTGEPWRRAVHPVAVRRVRANCRSEPSIDAGGRRVHYWADNVLDAKARTAWRCDGAGRGVTLRFTLPRQVRVAGVGLVPGYAKTDPVNGADRYAQNRRIERVRWSFDGGRWTVQTFQTAAGLRRLQPKRIPPVRTRHVTLTIEDSSDAPRNTVAISTVRLAAAAG